MTRRFTNTHPHEASSRHNRRVNSKMRSRISTKIRWMGISVLIALVVILGLVVFDQLSYQIPPEFPCEIVSVLVIPDLRIGECQPQDDGSLVWTVEVFLDPNLPPATRLNTAVCPIYDPTS